MMQPLQFAACLALAMATFTAWSQNPSSQARSSPASAATPNTASGVPSSTLSVTTPAAAPAAAAPAIVGDAKKGYQLTYTCQGCHGIVGYKNAYPNYHVPRIGGQSQQYLINALHEYKQGSRKHPTMQAQSQSFSDQDIADIAAFLSGLK